MNRLHHIAIVVSDMEKVLHFFQDLLGFEMVWHLPRIGGSKLSELFGLTEMEAEIAYLHAPIQETSIELVRLINPPNEKMRTVIGPLGKVILSIFVENLDSLVANLKREGWTPIASPMEMRSPDGKRINICCIKIDDELSIELFEFQK